MPYIPSPAAISKLLHIGPAEEKLKHRLREYLHSLPLLYGEQLHPLHRLVASFVRVEVAVGE